MMATTANKHEERIEQASDQLLRIIEFRRWVDTNVLFPTVPDSIVDPLRNALRAAEGTLVKALYDAGAVDKVAAIVKLLDSQVRKER